MYNIMWSFKKEYKDKIIFVKGYGNINTTKINANDIYKMSLLEGKKNLAKYIEKDGNEAKTTKKASK